MSKLFRPYVIAVALLGVFCLLSSGWEVPSANTNALWNGLAAFLVLCFVSEASYLKLRVGATETQSSIAFIPYIASFILFDSGWTALIAGASMVAVDFGVRRKAPIRTVFNTAQVVVSTFAAATVYQLLGGRFSLSAEHLHMPPIAVAAAATTYFFVNSTAVSIAISLLQKEPLRKSWVRIAGASLGYDLVSSPLGPLLAYLYAKYQVPGILLLIVPLYVVRHVYHVNIQLEQVNRDLLELMVKAIEARDPYTSGHSQRVSRIAEMLARQFGLGAKQVEQTQTAALLHDVGKIHEEYAPLLRKEGKLDTTEKALMQTHAMRSAELVSTISAFRGAITEAVRHHHENYDGTGYPAGIAGDAIPIGARIIMIADTVDAMTTDRPYRSALTVERVNEELERFAGKQFDPSLVAAFMQSTAITQFLGLRAGAVGIVPPRPARPMPWRDQARARNPAVSHS
jgi:putative nucleotidyltransferase with HDIG domain